MAHNIHRRLDGTHQALYVGKPAWHQLGDIEEVPQTADQIVRKVYRKRVITLVPAAARMHGRWVDQPAKRWTADEKAGVAFETVAADYQPIQDIDPLRMLEAIVTKAGGRRKAAFTSAFSLGNGARNAATLDLTVAIGAKALAVIRDTSPLEAFLVADWSHDGSGALKIMDSLNRVDCNNMLTAANLDAQRRGRLVRIIHSGSEQTVADQLREAERILGFATDNIKLSVKLLNELAAISLPKPDRWFKDFTELLVPIPEDMERTGSRTETRDLLTDLWKNSRTLVGVPPTPYRGLQVVTEYADHFRPLRISQENASAVPERRFRSIIEGPAAKLKSDAVELIRQEFEIPAGVN